MVWSIDYSTSGTTISFNICADVGGGYFYILMPDNTVLPSTLGGKSVAAGSCSAFSVQSTEFTQQGTYTMVLADLTPQEKTQAQVWFYVTPSPFSVTPPSGSSILTSPTPPPGGTPSCINIFGKCVNSTYLIIGGVGIFAFMFFIRK